MEGFRRYFEAATELDKNLRTTLDKLPASHRKLINGYKFHWQGGNILKGDDEHIGLIDPKKKTVTIAAPWNYGREFTLLHELAHLVWNYFVNRKHRNEWQVIVNNTKEKMRQNAEELFCMAYANHFAKNQIGIHDHPSWDKFIQKMVEVSKDAKPVDYGDDNPESD
jgi:hypothetical protein